MGELKPGWNRWRFDQIAHSVTDRVDDPSKAGVEYYIGLEHLDSESLKIRRWGSPEDVSATKLLFEPGDIIFGRRRAYQRKVGVAEFRGIASAHALILRAKPGVALPEFLPFFMQSDVFMKRAVKISVGGLSPTINWKTLAKQEFPLPPLEEQRRISGLLRAMKKFVDALGVAADSADSVCRALKKEYFLQDRGAENTRVGAIARVENGTTPRRGCEGYWGGDVPWLPTGKVNERRIYAADEFVTSRALSECSLSLIPAGSTLVAMIGQGKTRGKAAMLKVGATINQNFAAIVPSAYVEPRFLFYQMEAKYEVLRAWSQGTSQLALNCGLIARFPFWAPKLELQEEIANLLDEADSAHHSAQVRLTVARRMLRNAIRAAIAGGDS